MHTIVHKLYTLVTVLRHADDTDATTSDIVVPSKF